MKEETQMDNLRKAIIFCELIADLATSSPDESVSLMDPTVYKERLSQLSKDHLEKRADTQGISLNFFHVSAP